MKITRAVVSNIFLKGGEDHYNQGSGSKHSIKGTVDLWEGHSLSNETGVYSGYLYTTKAVKVIEDFAKATAEKVERNETPPTGLFLYLPWHNTHTPLECPEEWMYPAYYNNSDPSRMTYNGMAHILDDGVGNVTTALKTAGLWDDAILVSGRVVQPVAHTTSYSDGSASSSALTMAGGLTRLAHRTTRSVDRRLQTLKVLFCFVSF